MKNKSLLKSLFAGLAVVALTTGLTSCKKNDVDESGSANLKVINASPSSTPQGFYLANSTVVAGGLEFGDESNYVVTNSGNNLVAEFRNEGSSTPYATGKFDFDNGKNYSIFLAGDGQSTRIKVFTDDNAAPAAGKAKVRFIHLSDAAPANIDLKAVGGASLVANLARDNASNYINVDPGLLSLQVFQASQTTNLGDFNVAAFAEGKIYTVYITGSTSADIKVQRVAHN